MSGWWMENFSPWSSGSVHGIIVYSADGRIELVRDATEGILNNRGELAYKTHVPPYAVVVRRREEAVQNLVVAGDPAPGAGYFTTGGVSGPESLAASGLVVSTVYSAEDVRGLVCLDEQGAHLITKVGDPAPGGGTLRVARARFVSDQEIVFSATRELPDSASLQWHMYRATPWGIELLPPFRHEQGAYEFQVNARGTVLFYWPEYGRLTRVDRDGRVERLRIDRYDFGDGRRIAKVESYGLAADDTIVALVRFVESGGQPDDRPTAVVLLGTDEARLLAVAGDSDLPGGPFGALGWMFVAENLVLFSARPEASSLMDLRYFLYDLDDTERRVNVLPESLALSSPFALDLTLAGVFCLRLCLKANGDCGQGLQ